MIKLDNESYVVVSAETATEELYLSDASLISFSEFLDNSIKFESIKSARSKLFDRFISLSKWIADNSSLNINGIYICEVNDDNVTGRVKYL